MTDNPAKFQGYSPMKGTIKFVVASILGIYLYRTYGAPYFKTSNARQEEAFADFLYRRETEPTDSDTIQ